MDFVHLHLHSEYSLLDGAIRFERLFKLLKEYGMDSCAITDHGNMFGVIDFYFEAKEQEIKPIIGCEFYLTKGSRFEKKGKGEENLFHIVLLALNNEGYKNLLKLVTQANLEGFYYVPRIDKELLRTYNSGLLCLTSCLKGEIPSALLKEEEKNSKKIVEEYLEIFGDRLYFELQDNGLDEQKKVNEGLIKLSRYFNIPLVATNDCHYLLKEESKVHDILLCIQTGKTIHDTDRLRFRTDEFYLKRKEEMERAFSSYPQALLNTFEIKERCEVQIETGSYHFPEYVPPESKTPEAYLEELTYKGFEEKLEKIKRNYKEFTDEERQKYLERLNYELSIIKKTGFASYFLIVSDFISFAKKNQIPVGPGRGSAAGSLVAFCLGITDIDPIKYELLFERFLNPERITMPDIDVDFCMEGREKVIAYVTEKYGKDRVAQIITFGTMQSKAVVRDVGRALGMPYSEVDRIAKLIPLSSMGIEKAIEEVNELRRLYDRDERVKILLNHAISLEGLARHASTHAAGIVISRDPLTEYVPLYRGQKGETLTQFHMKAIEKIGLVKFDFLGLKTLTIIDSVIKLLRDEGIEIDLERIPLDDRKTYELLSSGNTSGIFQLESRGMRELLVKLKPSKFEDIIALIALYRPGPLSSGMIEEFTKRKNNQAEIKYDHEALEGILKETYGVIVYQEQIMKIATELAGFSMKDADALRKAISKKIPEELENYKQKFIEGAKSKGVKEEVARKIYEVILRFGQYGFNKSHSTAYALVAYQTAFLKAHYYVHFMAALLTNEVNNMDNLIRYLSECKEAGVEILKPDINKSEKAFTIVGNKIRFGFSGIKNVGDAAIENILETRKKVGSFNSFLHFLSTVDSRKVNRKVVESLIKAGCFDEMGLKRSELFYLLRERSEILRKSERNGQMDMFSSLDSAINYIQIPEMEELPYEELLKGEKEAIGFYFSEHPLKPFESLIRRINSQDIEKIREMEEGDEVTLCCIVNSIKEITTKKNERMAYINLEDTKGIIEALFFPDLYNRHLMLLKSSKPLFVRGTIEKQEEGKIRLIAKEVRSLEELKKEIERQVRIKIDCCKFSLESLKKLKEMILECKGEKSVILEFYKNGEKRLLPLDIKIDEKKVSEIMAFFKEGLDWEIDEILS